jgi:hypothetical protein
MAITTKKLLEIAKLLDDCPQAFKKDYAAGDDPRLELYNRDEKRFKSMFRDFSDWLAEQPPEIDCCLYFESVGDWYDRPPTILP